MEKQAKEYLNFLNTEFRSLYKAYEGLFWTVYVKDSTDVDDENMNNAAAKMSAFKSDKKHIETINGFLDSVSGSLKDRLLKWKIFFQKNITPEKVIGLRKVVADLESKISTILKTRKEGYIDPISKEFIVVKRVELMVGMRTDSRPEYRKAFFDAQEILALTCINEYVELVTARNEYARALGFDNFYDYKVQFDDQSTMSEIFDILETVYDGTKSKFNDIRELEESQPELRQPWNFHYMMTGSLEKQEDTYFQLETALDYWIRMMNGLGVNYHGATLRLDLLARAGKYDNGFCHQPDIAHKNVDGKMIVGETNFTCNAIPGQIGSGFKAFATLVHEGGHAAHFVNMAQEDVFYNNEYETSTALSETQSMLLDSLCISPEWLMRYARAEDGGKYTFYKYRNRIEATYLVNSLEMIELMRIPFFEKEVYEESELTVEKVKEMAIRNYKKCYDHSVDSLEVLLKPHIYNFDSACQYHNYELAQIALEQWKDYFYKKYNYIIDNPNIGPEMEKIWNLAGSISFPEMIEIAIGEKLSPDAYIKTMMQSVDTQIENAHERVDFMETIPQKGKLEINANIEMWHGNDKITDNSESLEKMISEYNEWLKTQY